MKPNRNNPVIQGLYADPEVLWSERDQKYYLYPTTDGQENWNNHDFRCYSSTDLKNWKYEGVIFDLQIDFVNNKIVLCSRISVGLIIDITVVGSTDTIRTCR